MCTVSVKVNEEAREMTHRAVSREYALDHDMTPEQLYAVISEEIDDIYANGWLLKGENEYDFNKEFRSN